VPAAVALILAGFTLIYSALTGESLADILSGKSLPRLNPAGGKGGGSSSDPGAGSQPRGPGGQGAPDPQHEFKGPHAGELRALAVPSRRRTTTCEFHRYVARLTRHTGRKTHSTNSAAHSTPWGQPPTRWHSRAMRRGFRGSMRFSVTRPEWSPRASITPTTFT
jgi:hypothetical protein